ncbi:unnamed protein product [Miscanthus lutarioriparius]|uniref:Uncharacterized protein n=1 Tax=Miscanthus lutarioriparius TaxID=422564 RepID=A0A811PPQ6_9POAL|nr:unnamed protein product [Miscanthus lutarioriparius]
MAAPLPGISSAGEWTSLLCGVQYIARMDRLVRLFYGGKVKGNGEFEIMQEHVQFFSTSPTFGGLVSQCRDKFEWPLRLRGQFNCGKERAHYVLMSLSCDDEWKNYIEVVKSSSVMCLEVVVEKGCSPIVVVVDDNVDVEPVENLTQDEELQAVVVREVDRSCEPGALNDDFDEETFDEDGGSGDGTHDMDDISQGSYNDEVDVASVDEDDLTSGSSTLDDVLEDEYKSEPSSEDESDCCEGGFPDTIEVPVDGSLRMEYNDVELRQLKVVHMEVPLVPNFMDISMVE